MQIVGVLLALTSAAVWGGGDFCGGVATKRSHQFQVLTLSALSGIVMLVLFSAGLREQLPSSSTLGWAMCAGVAGAIGIASLYKGLAVSNAAIVAPTAAVMTAVLPVLVTGWAVGLPHPSQLLGFALALLGIWLVARGTGDVELSRRALGFAVSAGVGFGSFLILIAQVNSTSVFVPLAISRTATLATGVTLLRARRIAVPSLVSNPPALLAGILDAGGNVFYLLAKHYVRLDVAAVLSSLYPVTTVILARIVSKDPITPRQWLGASLCLAAIVLITHQ